MSEVEGLKLPAWRYRWRDALHHFPMVAKIYRRGMIRSDIKFPTMPKTYEDIRYDRVKVKSHKRWNARNRPYGAKRGPVLNKIHTRKLCWGIRGKDTFSGITPTVFH